MKILVDAATPGSDRHDGISRYTAGIVAEPASGTVSMLVSDHRQLEMLPQVPWQR